MLYKEGDTSLGFYLVLFGKIVIHSKTLGAIGMVKMGEFIGEEMMFEQSKIGSSNANNIISNNNGKIPSMASSSQSNLR